VLDGDEVKRLLSPHLPLASGASTPGNNHPQSA
jgi:hypothetical protein